MHLVRRLRLQGEDVVYAPEFLRELDEPVAAAISIDRSTPIVIIEGNYLLLDRHPWRELRHYLDEAWYIDLDRTVRQQRLAERQQSFGLGPADAWSWAQTQDEASRVSRIYTAQAIFHIIDRGIVAMDAFGVTVHDLADRLDVPPLPVGQTPARRTSPWIQLVE